MYIVREAAPIVQALLLMVLVMLLGFLMVFSSYSIQAIAVASVAYFGIKFWTALWAVAYWVDNHMIDAMTPKENGMVAAVAYAIGLGDNQWLFNFITSTLYIVASASVVDVTAGGRAFASAVSLERIRRQLQAPKRRARRGAELAQMRRDPIGRGEGLEGIETCRRST